MWEWELPQAEPPPAGRPAARTSIGRRLGRAAVRGSYGVLGRVGLVAVTTVLVAVAVFLAAPVRYAATAESFVSPGPGTATQSDPYAGSTFVLQRMESYTALATSPAVLSSALREVGAELSVEELAAEVTAQNPPSSVLLTVTVTSPDRQQAADLANALALQQGRTVEALEGRPGSAEYSPVRVTLVTDAVAPPVKSLASRMARPALSGLVTGLVLLVVVISVARSRSGAAHRATGPTRSGTAADS